MSIYKEVQVKAEQSSNSSLSDLYTNRRRVDVSTIDINTNKKYDIINKPKHYVLIPEIGIEVRDICKVMASRLSQSGYSAMEVSDYIQMLQYILRFDQKNGKEDLKKAKFYLNELLNENNT